MNDNSFYATVGILASDSEERWASKVNKEKSFNSGVHTFCTPTSGACGFLAGGDSSATAAPQHPPPQKKFLLIENFR